MRRYFLWLLASVMLCHMIACKKDNTGAGNEVNDLHEIAAQAFIYGYPLVLMERTRQIMTAVPRPYNGRAPINQYAHATKFPDHTFTDVVSPNVDAFYSTAWLNLSDEPLIISVPDAKLLAPDGKEERYYLLQMLDGWSNVFDAPGTRTTGNSAQDFLLAGPDWAGVVPGGMKRLNSPTNLVWLIGRVQAVDEADVSKVLDFQSKLNIVPLSQWGTGYMPPEVPVEDVDPTPPVQQVANMDMNTFFQELADLMGENPPADVDAAMVAMLKNIGVIAGQEFDLSSFSNEQIEQIEKGFTVGKGRLEQLAVGLDIPKVNGWSYMTEGIGRYGTNYEYRAVIALVGIGANLPEDAVYPKTTVDDSGNNLNTAKNYTITFNKNEMPPAQAFWSVTMYNKNQFLADNPISRYSLGSKDDMKINPDGSLTIHIQKDNPGEDLESNWLPAPQVNGEDFNLIMRIYRPEESVLQRKWSPPAVKSQ